MEQASGIDGWLVEKRNKQEVPFDRTKIAEAMSKAFLAVVGDYDSDYMDKMTDGVVGRIVVNLSPDSTILSISDIQDFMIDTLQSSGHNDVAEAYANYRNQHDKMRAEHNHDVALWVTPLVERACDGLDDVKAEPIYDEVYKNLVFDAVGVDEILDSLILATKSLIETEPNYSYVAARLLLHKLQKEAFAKLDGFDFDWMLNKDGMVGLYPAYFKECLQFGVGFGQFDPRLLEFDLEEIADAIVPEWDWKFNYLGMRTVYDRYLSHHEGVRYELPQAWLMRVAMGLAVEEKEKEKWAIEFYNVLSNFDLMSSTPTLFNSGTVRPQLSSCFLTTIPDDLDGIYEAIQDNANMQKWAGGLGNDWTQVRGMGAHIKGTNGKSQGVVPFMKVANDTLIAVNQGGLRRGSGCAYLETWHIDIEDFLELRKNTGDERRRTHDMNTANWVPDLFMQRVQADGMWTLFSPDEVSDLHDLYCAEFKTRYEEYERMADAGEIKLFKRVKAVDLWRKMLTMLFETGHPWLTWKDPANYRNPQKHAGVVHSSNLCTEITLNTSDEIAVCNLASVNLSNHLQVNGALDLEKLAHTVSVGMRMLDNVIDINHYPVEQARRSNLKHRPVGLGVMGVQDVLHTRRIAYDSEEAVALSGMIQQQISYFAIKASCHLAKERGTYESYEGSLWSQGVLPVDSYRDFMQNVRGVNVDVAKNCQWDKLRNEIACYGMRNSNTMAIAPTATISLICGVSQSIEPTYQNLHVKGNLSGEFTVLNRHLVEALKCRGLWDKQMVNDLKLHDGSVQDIDRVPDKIKAVFKTAFEIAPAWLVKCAAQRQIWLDQSQSLNLYVKEPSGKALNELYMLAWECGLKTTYYLRTLGATRVAKTTMMAAVLEEEVCSLEEGCESCQ